MSQDLYNKWWIVSKQQLANLVQYDKIIRDTTKLTKIRNKAHHLVGGLYCKYSRAVQDLVACLDQTCQVQKRMSMQKLVDVATTRLNELKENLVEINISEYHYIDGNLMELKLIPHQVEILDPTYIFSRPVDIEDMWTKIQKGEVIYEPPPPQQVDSVTAQTQIPENPSTIGGESVAPSAVEEAPSAVEAEVVQHETVAQNKEKASPATPQKYVPPEKAFTDEQWYIIKHKEKVSEAVILIQAHERGRQSRLYYSDLASRYALKIQKTSSRSKPVAKPRMTDEQATRAQKYWRGYVDRQYLARRELQRRYLIGMIEPSWKSTAEIDKVQKTLEERRALRDQHLREYIQANITEKARVLRVVAPGLMEDIGDEIREWFRQWYLRAKSFDQYPPPEVGGSIIVVRGETMTPEQYLVEMARLKAEQDTVVDKAKLAAAEKAAKEKQKKADAENRKKEKAKRKKEALAEKKRKLKGEFDFKLGDTPTANMYKENLREYKRIFDSRKDEDNPLQKPYMDLITEEKCYEVQLEVRPPVDDLMRLELDLLNEALELDKWKAKGKKGKPKPKPPKKPAKPKKGKKGKKDPTANRSTEDLFQELADNGIIRTYPIAHLSDFKGDFSYSNWDKRCLDFDPPATLGDIRQMVTLNCILPLGAESMVKPKAVLIAGHRQSGKHVLANAIFYETRCVLFDLSPPVLMGKYPGKKGLKMLVHLVQKMSRLLQPSIIFIDGGEKPFYKKVPNEEKEMDPKRLGKALFKGIIKPILPQDKVLVLAISGQPFAAQAKGIKKAFSKIILIPRTDYGTIYLYWREMIMQFHGVDRNFNVSELAIKSVTYTLPAIKEACAKVLIPSRIIQFKYRPLDAHEFLDALLDGQEPINDKDWSKFQNWYKSLPLSKQRAIYLNIAELDRIAAAKAAEKAKAKK